MAPNLLVMAQTAVKPHRWFKHSAPNLPLARVEVWQEPVRGVYKHTPGCGWSLIAVEVAEDEFSELEQPLKVVYCKCLHRYLFEDELQARKMKGFYLNRQTQKEPVTFFRLDDEVTWVQCFDSGDNFIPGPYERFVLDAKTGKFRPMLKADDPTWYRGRLGSSGSSAVSSLHCSSGSNSPAVSRDSSPNRQERPRSRHVGSSTLEVPISEESKRAKRHSPSRPSSLSRPVREDELPRL